MGASVASGQASAFLVLLERRPSSQLQLHAKNAFLVFLAKRSPMAQQTVFVCCVSLGSSKKKQARHFAQNANVFWKALLVTGVQQAKMSVSALLELSSTPPQTMVLHQHACIARRV